MVRDDLHSFLKSFVLTAQKVDSLADLLPPIESQEVWAAGVTYYRSRSARTEESNAAGAADFYDRVYWADRPELFLKATPHRVAGFGGIVKVREDSDWSGTI